MKRKNVWLPPDLISCFRARSGRPAHQRAAPKRLKLLYLLGLRACENPGHLLQQPQTHKQLEGLHQHLPQWEAHAPWAPRPECGVMRAILRSVPRGQSCWVAWRSSAALHWCLTDPCVRYSNHFTIWNALLIPARYVSAALCSCQQTPTRNVIRKDFSSVPWLTHWILVRVSLYPEVRVSHTLNELHMVWNKMRLIH